MNILERFDEWQQRHALVAFPFAVLRKFGDDRGGHMAALLAYYAFFSLFPLLAVATTLLARVIRDDPELQRRVLDTALRNLPLIGPRIATNLRELDAGGVGLAVALALSIWAGLGAVKAFGHAMNTVWNVPDRDRPNFVSTHLRALIVLGSVAVFGVVAAVVASLGADGWRAGAGWSISFLLQSALLLCLFKVMTAAEVRWRDVAPGALVGAVSWSVLLVVGGLYVGRQIEGAGEVYGTFALVVGLLGWLYLSATVVLYAAELNVVWAAHLWPRSLVPPPLTDADRDALVRYAEQAERRPEVQVETRVEG